MRILLEYCQRTYTATLMDEVGSLCSSSGDTREEALRKVKRKALKRGHTDTTTVLEEVDMTDSEES